MGKVLSGISTTVQKLEEELNKTQDSEKIYKIRTSLDFFVLNFS